MLLDFKISVTTEKFLLKLLNELSDHGIHSSFMKKILVTKSLTER